MGDASVLVGRNPMQFAMEGGTGAGGEPEAAREISGGNGRRGDVGARNRRRRYTGSGVSGGLGRWSEDRGGTAWKRRNASWFWSISRPAARGCCGAVEGLSAEQRHFQPAEDRWSVAGNVEHIIVVEDFVFQTMLRVLQAPPEPDKQAEVRPKDQLIIDRVPARTRRVMGPPQVDPTNRWPEFEELLRQFEKTRERSVNFADRDGSRFTVALFPASVSGRSGLLPVAAFHGAALRAARAADGGSQGRHGISEGDGGWWIVTGGR